MRRRVFLYLPELLAFPLLPILIVQGRRTRRITPRLPPAPGPNAGIAGSEHDAPPLSLLALGESPVAGVGVASHAEGITGQMARALAHRTRRPVLWQAHGGNGVTVSQAMQHLLPCLPATAVDIVLVAFGVNDTTAFRSAARWQRELRQLLLAVQERCSPRLIVLSGVPPMGRFPALPRPLRWVLGLKAAVLDAAARDLAASLSGLRYASLDIDGSDPALMAIDGYHPSMQGCEAWGAQLAATCWDSSEWAPAPEKHSAPCRKVPPGEGLD